jgi:hypothetical protein
MSQWFSTKPEIIGIGNAAMQARVKISSGNHIFRLQDFKQLIPRQPEPGLIYFADEILVIGNQDVRRFD